MSVIECVGTTESFESILMGECDYPLLPEVLVYLGDHVADIVRFAQVNRRAREMVCSSAWLWQTLLLRNYDMCAQPERMRFRSSNAAALIAHSMQRLVIGDGIDVAKRARKLFYALHWHLYMRRKLPLAQFQGPSGDGLSAALSAIRRRDETDEQFACFISKYEKGMRERMVIDDANRFLDELDDADASECIDDNEDKDSDDDNSYNNSEDSKSDGDDCDDSEEECSYLRKERLFWELFYSDVDSINRDTGLIQWHVTADGQHGFAHVRCMLNMSRDQPEREFALFTTIIDIVLDENLFSRENLQRRTVGSASREIYAQVHDNFTSEVDGSTQPIVINFTDDRNKRWCIWPPTNDQTGIYGADVSLWTFETVPMPRKLDGLDRYARYEVCLSPQTTIEPLVYDAVAKIEHVDVPTTEFDLCYNKQNCTWQTRLRVKNNDPTTYISQAVYSSDDYWIVAVRYDDVGSYCEKFDGSLVRLFDQHTCLPAGDILRIEHTLLHFSVLCRLSDADNSLLVACKVFRDGFVVDYYTLGLQSGRWNKIDICYDNVFANDNMHIATPTLFASVSALSARLGFLGQLRCVYDKNNRLAFESTVVDLSGSDDATADAVDDARASDERYAVMLQVAARNRHFSHDFTSVYDVRERLGMRRHVHFPCVSMFTHHTADWMNSRHTPNLMLLHREPLQLFNFNRFF